MKHSVKRRLDDHNTAMANAISETLASVTGSSITTIADLLHYAL